MHEAVYVVKPIKKFKRKMRSLDMCPSDRTHISNPFYIFSFRVSADDPQSSSNPSCLSSPPCITKEILPNSFDIYISRTLCDMKRKNVSLTPDHVITNIKMVSINSKSHNRLDSKKTEY